MFGKRSKIHNLMLAVVGCTAFASISVGQNDVTMEEVTGTITQVNRGRLSVETPRGVLEVELVPAGGRNPETAIRVEGIDRVQILKTRMFARMVVNFDQNRQPIGTVMEIQVGETPVGLPGIYPFDPDGDFQFPNLDGKKNPPPKIPPPEQTRFWLVGQITEINTREHWLTLTVDTGQRRAERYRIEFDPELTRVRFRLTQASAIQRNDSVTVRGVDIDETRMLAVELRVLHPSPFPEEPAEVPATEVTAVDAPPVQVPMGNADRLLPETAMNDKDSNVAAEENQPLIPDVSGASETRFEFDDFPEPEKSPDPRLKSRRWHKIN